MEEDKKELYKLVKAEAKLLLEYAAPEERQRLDCKTINGGSSTSCIYGQITGSCHSERALFLIQKCAKKVYTNHHLDYGLTNYILNGSPLKFKTTSIGRLANYASPIEYMLDGEGNIYRNDTQTVSQNVKNLIAYLRNETDILELN